MNDELLPCPFCGHKADFRTSSDGTYQWIRCLNFECDAFGPFARTKIDAIVKWNNRVDAQGAQP